MFAPGEPTGVPLVSVIVPTYNSRATLRCALESIRRQDCTDFEVWVVGDGCTDGSGEVVAALKDPRFRWVNRATNSGSSSPGYREGLRRARGRYVAYLGHDDLWFPWHLSSVLEQAVSDGAPFVHALCALLGPDGWVEVAGPPEAGASYRGHFVPPSSWLHERTLSERVGGWCDADALIRAVDMDLFQRITASGSRISCSPRLSVLKWPSAWWRAYADDAPRPQIAVAAALAHDPQELAERILNECALSLSRRTWRGRVLTVRGEWRTAASHAWAGARMAVRDLTQPDGRPRWPLAPLLRWRFQRIRRRMRVKRGLAFPSSDSK